MKIKTIIVDDEILARELLKQMIVSLNMDIDVVAICSDIPDALLSINQHQPDLVFLDIEMPRFKGVEINQFLPNHEFDIIFTTAHSNYAIEAIKLGAKDYLLKPIDIDELEICLKKYIKQKSNDCVKKEICVENRLMVNTIQNIHLIDYEKIIYLKAEGAYTQIVSTDEKIIASKNLKYYEEKLSAHPNFIRIHKSYIVNKNKIKNINKAKQQAILTNEDIILISIEKLEKLFYAD